MTLLALAVLTAAALYFLLCYVCFRVAAIRGKAADRTHGEIEKNSPLLPFSAKLKAAGKAFKKLKYVEVCTTSRDGLKLYGRLYGGENRRIAILFHSHRSSAENDFAAVTPLLLNADCGVLLVDMRAHGKSEGRYISFGGEEKYDCAAWAEYITERFGDDTEIILGGNELGATAVLLAEKAELPSTVRAVIAAESFTSGFDIVSLRLKAALPLISKIILPTVNCFCRIFAGFDLRDENTLNALKSSTLPTLFIHGTRDRIVPCEMTLRSFSVCAAKKELLTVKGADHGTCFLFDEQLFCDTVKAFLKDNI